MAKTLRLAREHLTALVGLALIVAMLGTYLANEPVTASHEPANKFAAAGAVMQDIGPNTDHVVLRETMKVSTPFDLALSATAECSILTYLRSAGSTSQGAVNTSSAEGRVTMYVTIDGEPVPVQTGDTDPNTDGVQADDGSVTFCNREYERTIADTESPQDGIDEERDFIRTKNANAFNWFALDVGRDYDKPSYTYDPDNNPNTTNSVTESGQNIVVIELWARYFKQGTQPCQEVTAMTAQEDCSDAYVGKRTLVAEPTNASVHEAVLPAPGAGN